MKSAIKVFGSTEIKSFQLPIRTAIFSLFLLLYPLTRRRGVRATSISKVSLLQPSFPTIMATSKTSKPFRNTWLFSEDAFLRQCPSRKQMTVPQDLKVRELIYAFLLKLGSELKLDGRTILAATVYINRFYMRSPITTSKYFVACAAVAISCKLNDTYRPPDKIALTGCTIKNPNRKVDQHSSLFWQWRDQLLYREELILKMLNFELDVEFPYDFIDDLLQDKEEDLKQAFFVKLPEILKYTVSKVELVSALPLLICYDMRTLFGTMLILTVKDAQDRFDDLGTVQVPADFLETKLHTTLGRCYKCYSYLLRLKAISEDPKLPSHKNVVSRIPQLDQKQFSACVASSASTE